MEVEQHQNESSSLLGRPLRWGSMLAFSYRSWQIVALQGLVWLLYGTLALCFPGITLAIFTFMFATFAVMTGARSIYVGMCSMNDEIQAMSAWFLISEGVVCLVAGLWGLVWPGMTAVFMLYVVAAWAVLTGCSDALSGCIVRDEIQWGSVINGFILVVLGIFLYAESPAEGILALIWAVGVQGVIGGSLLLLTALNLRREQLRNNPSHQTEQADEEQPISSPSPS